MVRIIVIGYQSESASDKLGAVSGSRNAGKAGASMSVIYMMGHLSVESQEWKSDVVFLRQ